MLVLSRKRDDIIITIIEIRGDKVRLGVQAPGDVSVHRSEVWAKIQQERPLNVGTVVKYEGSTQSFIVAQVNPLVIVGVLGNTVYTTIHPDSLKIIGQSGSDWGDVYPAAHKAWMSYDGV